MIHFRSRCVRLSIVAILGLIFSGCDRQPEKGNPDAAMGDNVRVVDSPEEESHEMPVLSFEVNAEQLLSARLPADETAKGWVRVFDGHTLFGWQIIGQANFRVEDGAIVVDRGKQGLLCTSTTWGDFELTLQFNADAGTNSGIFVRTPLDPEDPALDCYEINIAPDDNPFPTGSVVKRQKVDGEAAGPQKPGQWRDMKIIADGRKVTVELDGNVVCQYSDPVDLRARRIGLQHNSGRVAFRDIRIRPLGLEPMLDQELTQWKKYPDMDGDFTVNEDGDLHVNGGKNQLETRESYDNFFLLSQYKIDKPEMNSGIFFRCIPGDEMMGYECQINNDFVNGSRLSPADCGTGGIFRRQDARIVAGENGTWSTVLLHAYDNRVAGWVNGVQVSDWEDTRDEDENPRRGRRDQAGTIMIQGHDPETDVLYREMQITTID